MKITTKVFLIIGMCLTCFLIYPIAIGILSVKKLDESSDIKEIKMWGWLSLFLVSIIGGILMLNLDEKDLSTSTTFNTKTSTSQFDKINDLKLLLDKGILNEEEFKSIKSKYIEELTL